MKIGTDGVLLGSIASRYESRKTLDVGTGCGLIALMIAQKSLAQITALEIDKQASETAMLNVRNSPWASRIDVVNKSFLDFYLQTTQIFDLIACNPPFFHKSHLTPDSKRNLARHSDTLSPAELLYGVSRILSDEGKLLVIIPFDQEHLWESEAARVGMHLLQVLRILPKARDKPQRSILEISRNAAETKVENLIIEKDQRYSFTREYIDLTKDYYILM